MTLAADTQFAATVERAMRVWLERAVIGLNLCPFAKAVHVHGQIHYAVSRAETPPELARDLTKELQALVAIEPDVRDTTLLMATGCLDDFLEFNRFLGVADRVLRGLGLNGVIQIASFHPDYQFSGTAANDITNFTNRAPYPTLHLLRESSVDRAVAAFPQAEDIFERNKQTLLRIGLDGWAALCIPHATGGKLGP